ncbi:MAG TPA: hypothetical protein VGB82_10070, partial [Alphaproteobacteria bacterium]
MSRLALLGGALLVLATGCATTTTTSTSTIHHGSPRRPTANGREEFERMILADEEGRIPPGALVRALDHVKRMRALNAVGEAAGIGRNSWTWLGPGNIGGRITTILVHPADPNRIWINNPGGGIWKTTNGGESWAPVDDFLANLVVSAMAMSPTDTNLMYAGTGGGAGGSLLRGAGIFKSTDGGSTWTQLAATAASDWSRGVERMAISPDGVTVVAATKSYYSDVPSALWRSTDGGATWKETLGARGVEAAYVEFHPTNSSLAIASMKSGEALYSTDGGASWSIATGIPSEGLLTLAYARSDGNTVYGGLDRNGGEIYKSTDGGRTYSLVNTGTTYLGDQGWYSNVVWVDPTNPAVVVIAGLDIYRSTDGGNNFTKISRWQKSPESAHADHGSIAAAGGYNGTTNRTVLFGNDGGLYRAPDVLDVQEEAGWQALNNNLGVTQMYGAAGNSGGVIMAGAQDNGSIRYAGDTQGWTKWQGGDGGFIAADPTDPKIFYGEYVYLTIYRSNDGGFATPDDIYGFYDYWNGSSWEKKARPNPITEAKAGTANFIAPFILDPNNPNRLLAGARSLWVTDNARIAKTEGWPDWRAIKPLAGNATANNISAIAVAPVNSDRIWVGHGNGDVFVTTSGTAASPVWTKVDDGSTALPNRFVTRIAVDPRDNNVVYVSFGGFSANNLWKTTDGGTSWTPLTGSGARSLPQAPVETIAIHPNNSQWLYAGTEVGIFASEDGGATWNVPQDGPANVSVKELFWIGSTLHAATFGRGLYKIDIPVASKAALPCYTLTTAADDISRGGVVADVQP